MSQTVGVLEIQLMAGMARLSDDMRKAERVVSDSTGKMEKSVTNLQSQFNKLGMGLSVALIADQLRVMNDSFTKVNAQMRIATGSQAEYAKGMEDVMRISTAAQAGIESTTMLYTRLTNSLKQHGATQQQVGNITEAVSLGLKAYGATTAEAASAMLQLSQAFGSNRLGGEEFRAVSEAMPNMMQKLADSMNVPKSAIRQLSIEGKITSEVMMKAWGDPAILEGLRKQAEMTRTITGEYMVLRNNVTMLVGEFMKSSGSMNGITGGIQLLTEAVKLLAKYLNDIIVLGSIMAATFAGKYIVSITNAMIAQKLLNVAHAEALVMNVAEEKARQASIVATMASVKNTIELTTAKLAHANAIGVVTVAQYNETRAAAANVIAKQAERGEVIQNLSLIGTEAAAVNASIASKGAAVSKQLRIEQAAIMERRAIAKIELAQIDASIAAYQLQANANSKAKLQMMVADAERAAIQRQLIALDEAQVLANKQLAESELSVAAATQLRANSSMTLMQRAGSLAGKAGFWGLILWGAYEIADHLGWIDKIFNSTQDRFEKLQGKIAEMQFSELVHEQRMAEIELKKQQNAAQGRGVVWGGISGGSTELYEAEKALKAINLQLKIRREELQKTAEISMFDSTDEWKRMYATKAELLALDQAKLTASYVEQVEAANKLGVKTTTLHAEYLAKRQKLIDDYNKKEIADSEKLLKRLTDARIKSLADLEAAQKGYGEPKKKELELIGMPEFQALSDPNKEKAKQLLLDAQTVNEQIASINAGAAMDEYAREQEQYAKQLKAADDYAAALELRAQQQFTTAADRAAAFAEIDAQNKSDKEALEIVHQKKLFNIALQGKMSEQELDKMGWKFKLSVATTGLGALFGESVKHSRAMFNMQKNIAKANVLLNIPESVSAAYKAALVYMPWAGPVGASIAGGVALAAQLAQLASLNATEFGGGGSTASMPSSSGAPSTQAQQAPATPLQSAANPSPVVSITIMGAAANPSSPTISYDQLKQMQEYGYITGVTFLAG